MTNQQDGTVEEMPEGLVVAEAASYGGLFGLVAAGLAGLLAALVLRRRRQ